MGLPAFLHPYVAIAVTLGVFVALQYRRGAATDVLFLGAAVILAVAGVITPQEAIGGFASEAVLTIAGLLVVASGLRCTGVLDWIGQKLLGSVRDEAAAQRRLIPTIVATSAFLLNTAVVAMLMPVLIDWCRRHNLSPSRLLLPLSYVAILGGVCTSIGTSTTIVVNGLLREEQRARQEADTVSAGQPGAGAREAARRREFTRRVGPLSLFELGQVGLPCAVVGSIFMWLFASRLLPRRTDLVSQLDEHRREYLVELMVQADCPLIGKSVEAAGLRHLPGLFLIEIDRDGDVMTPVAPDDIIRSGDRLIFTGVVSTIVDLEKIPGLVPAADITFEFHPQRRLQRRLTEVVLSRTSPLIGTTVREGSFRQRYNAAVIAVHRNGVRLTNKIGNIVLEPGDTLLLQTRTNFVETYSNHRDFYLVSSVEGAEPRLHHKRFLAAGLALVLVAWLSLASWFGDTLPGGLASPPIAALTIAGLMILTRCLRVSEARQSLDLSLLVTIAGALAVGRALTTSGAAQAIATTLVTRAGDPMILLVVVFVLTLLFTETITNNAVAAMLLPIAVAVAWQGGHNPRPFIVAITLAASLSFMTPIGYQTNLMVMGPGGYRPLDYLRLGAPLAALVAVTALVLIPRVWAF